MFTIVGYVVRSPIFFFLIGDLMEIGLRSAAFLPLISLKKGLKFASHYLALHCKRIIQFLPKPRVGKIPGPEAYQIKMIRPTSTLAP